nr:MAG TPA: hypothetical protein [Caudoviricetes sp.]DAJ33177.1 MAG TPA: hypothetical protein [Caudoviricetes sp.]DAS16206.1 MAG TPA: hypothetical protein [Caudoviricetes sp.]
MRSRCSPDRQPCGSTDRGWRLVGCGGCGEGL